ncbi:MAG TPA: hypothetical protein VFT10_06920 [Solirubrobacterales bacterium]|nr:hypothetical protein [Solirubrobacterales bacterium]
MGKNAAYRGYVSSRSGLIAFASLAAGGLLLLCLAGTAAAGGPVGKDGHIHACYRVKGKPKGALRVVRSSRTRCRRGERKAAWSVAGPAGVGSEGAQGQAGASGSAGANEAALKAQVGALSMRVETLEGTLQGIANATKALCEQSEQLTEQVNLVTGVVGGLGLSPALEALGLLEIPTLPAPLAPFDCPTS